MFVIKIERLVIEYNTSIMSLLWFNYIKITVFYGIDLSGVYQQPAKYGDYCELSGVVVHFCRRVVKECSCVIKGQELGYSSSNET